MEARDLGFEGLTIFNIAGLCPSCFLDFRDSTAWLCGLGMWRSSTSCCVENPVSGGGSALLASMLGREHNSKFSAGGKGMLLETRSFSSCSTLVSR